MSRKKVMRRGMKVSFSTCESEGSVGRKGKEGVGERRDGTRSTGKGGRRDGMSKGK